MFKLTNLSFYREGKSGPVRKERPSFKEQESIIFTVLIKMAHCWYPWIAVMRNDGRECDGWRLAGTELLV